MRYRSKTQHKIADFVYERDEAVRTLDVKVFKKFYQKWYKRGVYAKPLPPDDVLEIVLRKMLFHMASATEAERMNAKAWLMARGMDTNL